MEYSQRRLLTVDIGNTAVKAAIYEGEHLVHSLSGIGGGVAAVESMLAYYSPDGISVCCVGADKEGVVSRLSEEKDLPLVVVNSDTKLPFELSGYSRAGIGADRLAAAAGAMRKDKGVLVVDAGTAITSDLILKSEFMGGNIAPGLSLRFRSLAAYTSKLPLVSAQGFLPEFGHNTDEAIRAGVVRGVVAGIVAEFEAACALGEKKIGNAREDMQLLLTGGDADFLAPLVEQRGVGVVVDHQAVGRGLVRIFNCNRD